MSKQFQEVAAGLRTAGMTAKSITDDPILSALHNLSAEIATLSTSVSADVCAILTTPNTEGTALIDVLGRINTSFDNVNERIDTLITGQDTIRESIATVNTTVANLSTQTANLGNRLVAIETADDASAPGYQP